MDTSELFDRMQGELDAWRAKLELARVQAHLGKRELEDALERFEPTYDAALERLGQTAMAADARARALRGGIEAGWRELRTTYGTIREQQRRRPG